MKLFLLKIFMPALEIATAALFVQKLMKKQETSCQLESLSLKTHPIGQAM